MRLIFFGSSDFSTPFLKSILSSRHEIIRVFTGSDKKAGRGRKIIQNPVKKFSIENDLDFYSLDIFRDKDVSLLKKLQFECAIVVSFGKLIPEELLSDKKKIFINVHPSDLPKYRGPSPIESTIIYGERQTAITIIEVFKEMDEGDILAKTVFGIGSDENKDDVESKHIRFGTSLLIDVLETIEEDRLRPLKQDNRKAGYTRLFKKSDYRIDWRQGSENIYNKIRAFGSFPGAFAFLGDRRIQILEARLLKDSILKHDKDIKPGTIVKADRNDGLVVYVGNNNYLSILKLKPEGKKEISFKDFLNGYNIRNGDMLT